MMGYASEHLGVRTGVRICRGFRRKIRSCFPYNRRCDFHGVRGRFPRNPHLKKTAVRPMDSVDFASRMSAESVGASAPLMWRIRTSNLAGNRSFWVGSTQSGIQRLSCAFT